MLTASLAMTSGYIMMTNYSFYGSISPKDCKSPPLRLA